MASKTKTTKQRLPVVVVRVTVNGQVIETQIDGRLVEMGGK